MSCFDCVVFLVCLVVGYCCVDVGWCWVCLVYIECLLGWIWFGWLDGCVGFCCLIVCLSCVKVLGNLVWYWLESLVVCGFFLGWWWWFCFFVLLDVWVWFLFRWRFCGWKVWLFVWYGCWWFLLLEFWVLGDSCCRYCRGGCFDIFWIFCGFIGCCFCVSGVLYWEWCFWRCGWFYRCGLYCWSGMGFFWNLSFVGIFFVFWWVDFFMGFFC